jgi:putative membrane protein
MRLNMRFFTAGILGAALLLFLAGCQQSDQNVQAARETTADTGDRTNKTVLNDSDRDFLKKAEDGDIKERNIGRVVLEKSQTKDVKDYAQMLVDDHTKDLRKVVDLMNQKGMAQPKELPEVQHEALGKLNGLSGAALDREFMSTMVEDHQKDITEFRKEVNSAQDEDVKYYAQHTLPVLQEHLQKAQMLNEQLSSGSRTRTPSAVH